MGDNEMICVLYTLALSTFSVDTLVTYPLGKQAVMAPVLLALERTLVLTAEDQEAIGWFEEGGLMRPWLSASGPPL